MLELFPSEVVGYCVHVHTKAHAREETGEGWGGKPRNGVSLLIISILLKGLPPSLETGIMESFSHTVLSLQLSIWYHKK